VKFVGPLQDFVAEAVDKNRLQDVVEMVGRVPHADAISYMKGASCLLFQNSKSLPDTPSGQEEHFIAGKLFEYIGSGRPVLGFVQDNSPSAQILRSIQQAKLVTSDHPPYVAAVLDDLYSHATSAAAQSSSTAELEQFDRRTLTGRLASLFERLVQ
jgi:glycosyltransferase involved in cell wall biosynthesis